MRHSCERYKKAKYGSKDGVDRSQISRMLSFLHGRINGKDKNKSSEASEAKSIYQNLQDPTEKKSFIDEFFANGSGKSAGSLKFAGKFRKRIEVRDNSQCGLHEEYITRAKVLQLNGLSMKDYSDQASALAAADKLIKRAMIEYEYTFEDHPAMIDAEDELLSRFYYMQGKGKTRTWSVDLIKTLDNKKDLKAVEDIKKNIPEALTGKEMTEPVKSEFPLWDEVKKMNVVLKS